MQHSEIILKRSLCKRTTTEQKEAMTGFILSVYKNALLIVQRSTEVLTVQLAALLHDTADSKFHDG
jgi:hypothetical protein